MKRIIVLLVIALLSLIVMFQVLHYFRFSLREDYDYASRSGGMDMEYHDPQAVLHYFELATKVGSFAREMWFNYGIDVKQKDLSDTMSINATKTYDQMMTVVKVLEAKLVNSYELKLDGFGNKDVKYMEEHGLSPVEYELIGKFQGKNYQRGDLEQGVWEMQNLMNTIGQKIKIDGNFDIETEDAVKKFQNEIGIYPSGKADEETLKRMITAHLKAQ